MTRATATLLLLAAAFLHWPSEPADFSYDDADFVVANASLRSPRAALSAALSPFPPEQRERGLYRPLTNLSYALDYAHAGLDAAAFHRTNTLLYALLCLLAWTWFSATLPGPLLAFAAALLFSVHPVHCDAVDSIAGRSELLALLFGLASLTLFEGARSARRGGGLALASAACYALACLSKETAVVLPGVMAARLALTGWGRPELAARALRLLAPSAGVLIAYFALRIQVLGGFAPSQPVLGATGALDRLATFGAVSAEYARLLLLPMRLQLDYYYQSAIGIQSDFAGTSLIGLSLVGAGLTGAGLATTRHLRERAASAEAATGGDDLRVAALTHAAVAFAFLLPVSHVIPFGALMAERFLFAPSLGLVALAVLALYRIGQHWIASPALQRNIGVALLAIVCALFGLRTSARASEWRDGIALWSAEARVLPNDYRVYSNLGEHQLARGELETARASFERALALEPAADAPLLNLAVALEQQGEIERARELYERLLARSPDDFVAWSNIGTIEGKDGRTSLAARHFRRALRLNPNYEAARQNLAVVETALVAAERYLHSDRVRVAESGTPLEMKRVAQACRATGDKACEARFEALAGAAGSAP